MIADNKRPVEVHWNAGELGCGGLITELCRKVQGLKEAEQLHLTARGPGAPVDIPAWCRITGHVLVLENHPDYIIAKKGD